jgi:hypothetical protein
MMMNLKVMQKPNNHQIAWVIMLPRVKSLSISPIFLIFRFFHLGEENREPIEKG